MGNQIFYEDLFSVIQEELKTCTEQILIVSPYISLKAAKLMCKAIPDCVEEKWYVTVPLGFSYATNATCPDAINWLHQNGFKIRTVERLHAKLYLLDKKILFTGSANFSQRGLSLVSDPNKELLLRVELDRNQEEYESILEEYWNEKKSLIPDEEWVKKVNDTYGRFRKTYKDFVKGFRKQFGDRKSIYVDFFDFQCSKGGIDKYNQIPIGMGRNAYTLKKDEKRHIVKICLSDNNRTLPREVDSYYTFTIPRYSRKIIRDKKVGYLLLILGGNNSYLLIPKNEAVGLILDRKYRKKGGLWQFQIIETNGRYNLQISSKNSRRITDVTQFHNLELG